MGKKYFYGNKRSESLVFDYIDGSRPLNKMIGNAVLLYCMADDSLDRSSYRRLTTSARALRDRNKTRRKRRDVYYNDGQQSLFDPEYIAYLIGDNHEC